MINFAQIPILGSPTAVVFDPAYQAVLDYAILQGWAVPSQSQQLIENQKVRDLKAAGIWAALDLFYFFATDGDENYAKINWINPGTKQLSETGTVTFNSGSNFQPNGSTGYLSTGWNPSSDGVNFALDDCCVFIKILNEISTANVYQFGVDELSSDTTALSVKNTGQVHRFGLSSTSVQKGSSVSSVGFFQIQRRASNDLRIFKDGSQVDTTSTQASTNLSGGGHAMIIGAFNVAGVPAGFSDAQIACFGLGASLTGLETTLDNILG